MGKIRKVAIAVVGAALVLLTVAASVNAGTHSHVNAGSGISSKTWGEAN